MSHIHDIAVIGGGINGAGIARDAAGRGADVILLEQGDLARGTSSASTKLIHGGLRYLEHREFALVREALSEREVLWANAPHIIRPMRFILPHREGGRPRWLLRVGLFLYDHIGGRRALPPTRAVDLASTGADAALGAPLQSQYARGFIYSDGWVDDARLVVLNARDAADRGATIRLRCGVQRLERVDGIWHLTTEAGLVRARAVVNAAGPGVLDLLDRAGRRGDQNIRLVRGSHIVVRRLFDHDHAYFFQLPDGRIFFAIPYEGDFTLIGTTDADHTGPLTGIRASAEEIAYLCAGVNDYFRRQIRPAEVVWSYAGVRPLVDDGKGRPEAASRGYRFELDGGGDTAPLLSIYGGKITTYRQLAQGAVDRLVPHVPALTGARWTHDAPLPGGDFPMHGQGDLLAALQRRRRDLGPDTALRLVRAYGTLALAPDGPVGAPGAPDHDFGHGLFQHEVDYLIAREWATSAEDILWRRTKLGLRLSPVQVQVLQAYVASHTHGENA